jgi:hypothetical protein
MAIHLNEGEKILKTTYPHFLAMLHLYLIWLYLGAVGGACIMFRGEIVQWIHEWPQGQSIEAIIYLTLWSLVIVIPAVVVTVFQINWRWLFLSLNLCAAGVAAHCYQDTVYQVLRDTVSSYATTRHAWQFVSDYLPIRPQAQEMHNYLLIAVSLMGLFASNSYRRSHRYYITNHRIVTRFGFLAKRERDLLYGKVDDLIVHQSLLGRIFNFGTIIPISASGIGTGSDQAFVAVHGGMQMASGPKISVEVGGGKSVTVPRAPSFYSLYGVSNPAVLKEVIIHEMEQREHGYTRRKKESEGKKE